MSQTLRVSLYGGPGTGKTLMAADVFSRLKKMHCSVEVVNEYIKSWAYEGKVPQSFDQVYIFAKQQRLEDRLIRAGVNIIVSDSPLYLQCYYSRKYSHICADELLSIAHKFEQTYPASLHVFLKRHNSPYQQQGRYETYEQALIVDAEMQNFLDEQKIDYSMQPNDVDSVVVKILHHLKDMNHASI